MTTARDIRNQIAYAKQMGLEEGRDEGIKEGIEKGMEKGRGEGLKEGMEKGMEKGMEQERFTIASNLKASGVPPETIVQATGLTLEQVAAL